MTNQQLYFAILVPVFVTLIGMSINMAVVVWQAKGVEKTVNAHMAGINGQFQAITAQFQVINGRLDRIESRLTTIEQDYKVFFKDITQIKAKVGL